MRLLRFGGERAQHFEEDGGARREVGRVGVLGRVVRDAADGGDEDHPRRADPGEHLGIVPRARRHTADRVAELRGRVLDERHDPFVELDRLEPGQ